MFIRGPAKGSTHMDLRNLETRPQEQKEVTNFSVKGEDTHLIPFYEIN